MSDRIGFLVVNQKTGHLLEGKDHAAKVFDDERSARSACQVLSANKPVALNYENMVKSLLKGSTFCFDTEEGHRKFISRLRNDMANKPFIKFSEDRARVRWRYEKKPEAAPANVVTDAAVASNAPATGSGQFNPDVLVRTPFP